MNEAQRKAQKARADAEARARRAKAEADARAKAEKARAEANAEAQRIARAEANAEAQRIARAEANAEAQRIARARAEEQKAKQAEAAARAAKEAKARADASEAERVKREKDKAAADAKAKADAANPDAKQLQTNRELFLLVMGQAFDLKKEATWINSLFDSAKTFYDQGIKGDTVVELLLRQKNAPKPFTDRFRLYLDKDAADTAAGKVPRFGNIATFLATERAIGEKLSSYGSAFQALNTQENINNLISGDVAADEVGRRIDNAYYAINTADAALKEQIKNQFPGLNDNALAASLVTGNVDSIQQEIKFGAAKISASAKLAGYTPLSNLEDLSKQGVTREDALKGFQQVVAERSGISQASRMFGGKAPTQAELEAEALKTGGQSLAANRLRSQARAQFAGQSGITTGSLGRKKQV